MVVLDPCKSQAESNTTFPKTNSNTCDQQVEAAAVCQASVCPVFMISSCIHQLSWSDWSSHKGWTFQMPPTVPNIMSVLCSPHLCRVLLIAVAILSLYSVHLLLVTAKEGGRCFLTYIFTQKCLKTTPPLLESVFCYQWEAPSGRNVPSQSINELEGSQIQLTSQWPLKDLHLNSYLSGVNHLCVHKGTLTHALWIV